MKDRLRKMLLRGQVLFCCIFLIMGIAAANEEGSQKEQVPAESGWKRLLSSFDISGDLVSKAATDMNKDNDVEDLFDFRNRLRIKLQAKISDRVKFLVSEQIRYNLYKNTDTDDIFEPDLWEAYVDLAFEKCEFRIGKQIVRWGKTDELSPIDNINPQEYEEFILPKLNDRKIPLLLAKVNYYLDDFNLEGIFIPFFEESHIPSFNSDWAAFDHLKEAVARSFAPPFLKDLVESIKVKRDKPPRIFRNSSFGLRVLKTIGKIDTGFSYLYTRNPLPSIESAFYKGEGYRGLSSMRDLFGFFQGVDLSSLRDPNLTRRFKRMNVWGAEMETTWGNVGIRGELAYFHQLTFANAARSEVEKDVIHYVMGTDYLWGENLYTNIQFSQQIVVDYEDLFWQEEITSAFNGTVRKEFLQGFLIPELYFYWNITEGDYYLNPFITYKYTDNISLIGGFYFLDGERDTLMGNFKDNDEVYLALKYTY